MAEAIYVREFDEQRLTLAGAISVRDIWQMGSGEAAVSVGLASGEAIAGSSGERYDFETRGKYTVTKATGVVILDGARVYWDHSANAATFRKVNDRDFYIGRAVGDAASADATLVVDLNADPPYDVDLLRDPCLSVPVGTQAVGAFGYPKMLGGAASIELTATDEAQKIDLLSVDGFAVAANAIVDIEVRVTNDGAGTAADLSLGVANATHATNADSITEHLFFHLDANATAINLQSADGTTTVSATDTTTTYTEGSAVANRKHLTIDLRNPADIQCYVDGVLVLGSSTFRLDNATGPLFLLAHLEKTSSTDVYAAVIDKFRARFMEQ